MKFLTLALVLPVTLLCQTNPIVRFQTNLGDMDVELYADAAPKTVANFLSYMNKGAYTNSIFHRSVTNFVIQGGGFRITSTTSIDSIPADPPVVNEYKVSNTRGTIAMAKLGNDPNSATNQWFFNLRDDNATNLDFQNGGFTVFGKILDDAGLAVMDRIAAVPKYSSVYSDSTPLINYRANTVVLPSNFVTVFAVRPHGASTAIGFGGYTEAAAGSYLEILGRDLAGTTRTWATADFNEGTAPTTLDDVRVTIGGAAAFISYISPKQVNVQVPENAPMGENVPVVVTYAGQERIVTTINIKSVVAGLLAPNEFKVGSRQYVVAQHANRAFVANQTIPNVPAAPAVPGETLTIYGIGFGPVTSGPIAGRAAEGLARTQNRVQFFFGDREAEVQYAGLAPGLVGLYQFNVVVPAGLGTGDVPLSATVAGTPLSQTLYIPVRE